MALRVFIMLGILARVFTSESLSLFCGFISLSLYLIFLCRHCTLSENTYYGLNSDTAKCCFVFDGS